MAVTIIQQGGGFDAETYDKVVAAAGVNENPPEGLILHTANRSGDQLEIIDVWESEEQYDTFVNERLMPAMREVIGEMGEGTPAKRMEVHNMMGSGAP